MWEQERGFHGGLGAKDGMSTTASVRAQEAEVSKACL